MIHFFENEIKEEINRWYGYKTIDYVKVYHSLMIPYNYDYNIRFIKDNDKITSIKYICYDKDGNVNYEGEILIQIIDYPSTNIYHVRYVYIEGKSSRNVTIYYQIFDIFRDGDIFEFHVSGEVSQVSQRYFINDDKRVFKIYSNKKVLEYLQDITKDLIRSYYADKQKNKLC